MKIVQNISDQRLAIPGVGIVAPGGYASVPDDFHNANFAAAKSSEPKAETEKVDEEGHKLKKSKK